MHQDISIERAKILLKEGWTPIFSNHPLGAEYQITLYKEGTKDREGQYMVFTAHFSYYCLKHAGQELADLMGNYDVINGQITAVLLKYLNV